MLQGQRCLMLQGLHQSVAGEQELHQWALEAQELLVRAIELQHICHTPSCVRVESHYQVIR